MADEAVQQGDARTLTIYQHRDFRTTLQYRMPDQVTPIPLTNWTATGQVRLFAGGPKMADFTCVVNGPAGEVTLTLTDTQTGKMKQNGVYDIELSNGTTQITFLRGKVKIVPRVTQ